MCYLVKKLFKITLEYKGDKHYNLNEKGKKNNVKEYYKLILHKIERLVGINVLLEGNKNYIV